MSSDPLLDPDFPDRPQHPDFWRLSEVILYLDGESHEGGKTLPEMHSGLIDTKTANYMCRTRVLAFLDQLGVLPIPELVAMMTAAMMNGLVAGILFEKRGGNRDG